LISYNRRVIIPSPTAEHSYQIQPAFKLHYRLLYLLLLVFVTGYVLTAYVALLRGVLPTGNTLREYLICGGQLVFQGVLVSLIAKAKTWDYLGNMMTISFGGAILLMPVLLLARVMQLSPVFCTGYFMLVAGLMFVEHIRRTRLLGLSITLSLSWVAYRLLILALIFLAQ
jgi:hypothetical protein